MALFEMSRGAITAVPTTSFRAENVDERGDLQRLLRDQIEVIDGDLLVLGEEFGSWDDSRRRIDLLALDREANLVVIELKRGADGGHMDLQAIRYAAMVSTMTFEQATSTLSAYLAGRERDDDPESLLLDFLGWTEPDEEAFGQEVRIILVAADFSKEITTSVLWLNQHGLDIRCVRLRPYKLAEQVVLEVEQIIPIREAAEYQVRVQRKEERERTARRQRQVDPWSGYLYVNVGQGPNRNWEDCRKYGFLSAGQGAKYSGPLRQLKPGDQVFAYQPRRGYVGYGVITAPARMAKEFMPPGHDQPLFQLPLQQPGIMANAEDPEKCEWVVAVDWKQTVPLAKAKTFKGVFANQNIVCKLSHSTTLEFLRRSFGLDDDPGEVGT